MVSTRVGSNVSGTCCMPTSVRIINPAPTSSTVDSPISAITNAPRSRAWRAPAVADRPPSRSACAASVRGDLPGRHQPGQDGADGRQPQREQQHRRVEADVRLVGNGVRRNHRRDRPQARLRQRHAEHAAGRRQRARSPSGAGAPAASRWRRATRAAPSRAPAPSPAPAAGWRRCRRRSAAASRPRRAGRPASGPGCWRTSRRSWRTRGGTTAGNRSGCARREVGRDRTQRRLGPRDRRAGPEAAHDVDRLHARQLEPAPIPRRQVDVGAAPHEAPRHHADDLARRAVETHRPPDHRRIAAELPLPEAVAEQRDRRRVGAGRRPPPGSARAAAARPSRRRCSSRRGCRAGARARRRRSATRR